MLCKHGKKAVRCWSPIKLLSSEGKWSKNLPPYSTLTKHFFLLSPLATLKSCEMAKTRRRKKFLLCSRAGFDSFFFNIIRCVSWTSVEQSQHGFGLIQKFLVVSFINCGPLLSKFNAIDIQICCILLSSPHELQSNWLLQLKFMFSKKATKFDKIFPVYLTLCSGFQINGEDLVNFCGLLRKHEQVPQKTRKKVIYKSCCHIYNIGSSTYSEAEGLTSHFYKLTSWSLIQYPKNQSKTGKSLNYTFGLGLSAKEASSRSRLREGLSVMAEAVPIFNIHSNLIIWVFRYLSQSRWHIIRKVQVHSWYWI